MTNTLSATGSCSCPGMVGASIGGGVGRYQGLYGLMVDNILSARLVTATGEVVIVSETENSDLFWAIRGAGANFGIVTSITYRLHPLSNNGQVLTADFIIPASQNGSYFDLIESFQQNMTDKLATISIMEYNATVDEVCALF